ncbi:MAG TPA: tetratricopeptide repeat protein [Oculatellaceae cyanobacterium]
MPITKNVWKVVAAQAVGLLLLSQLNQNAFASSSAAEDHWHALCEKGDQAEIGREYPKAEQLFREALAAARPFGPKSKQMQTSLARMGTILVLEAQFDQADPYFVQCMGLLLDMNKTGESDPDSLVWLDDFGDAYQEMGRKIKAKNVFCLEHCVALRQAIAPGKHSKLASACQELAAIYIQNKKYADAEKLLNIQIQCICSKYGPKALVFSPLSNLAIAQEKQGKFKEAELNMTKAIDLMDQNHVPPMFVQRCRVELSRIQAENKGQVPGKASGKSDNHAATKPSAKN